jgi:hypothetical protein
LSHTTSINSVPMKDISALRAAVERLKGRGVHCELVENAKPRMYFRHQEVDCDFVLRLPNSKYDVGFEKNSDGAYVPIFDEWAGEVGNELAVKACPMPNSAEEKAMHAIGSLSQEYARCSAVNAAAAQGYFVESEVLDAKGEYQMVFASTS